MNHSLWGQLQILIPQDPLSIDFQTLTTDDLTSLFIYAMLALFIITLGWFFGCALIARRRIAFVRKIIRGIKTDNLASMRLELRTRANKRKSIGLLWKEFDETLVADPNGNALFNTLDAEYFFNNHQLASSINESRLVLAMPGVLTALGVLGTFVGLSVGLSEFNFQPDAQVQDLLLDIRGLFDGAKVAFVTSVWGILLSILYNILEKAVDYWCISKPLVGLQKRINYLFPRKTPEAALALIEQSVNESERVLKQLGEKIGDRLQEALRTVSRDVSVGIRESMAPAIESLIGAATTLAQRQGEGAQEALDALTGRFLEKLGGITEAQRAGLQSASAQVDHAIQDFGDQVKGLGTNMASFMNGLQQQFAEAERRERDRKTVFTDELNQLRAHQQTTTEQLSRVLGAQVQSSAEVVRQSEQLAERFLSSKESLLQIADRIAGAAGELREASGSIREFSGEIRTSSETLTRSQESVAQHLATMTTEGRATIQEVNRIVSVIERVESEINEVSKSLLTASQFATDGFEKLGTHQRAFLQQLESSVQSLQEQVARLLREYGAQVQTQTNDRLNEWNLQTREFSSNMVEAVNTIYELVGELQIVFSKNGQAA